MAVTIKITKQLLDSYYVKYNSHSSSKDPIWNLNKVTTKSGKEILAFIIACYCYGNITQINKFIQKVLDFTTPDIYKFILNYKRSSKEINLDFRYRFNTNQDFFDLIYSLSQILKKYGSLKSLFLKYYDQNDGNVIIALNGFTSEIRNIAKGSKSFEYLVPVVSRQSTCKRLFLFLRWMVRMDNIDTGFWGREVHTSKLIMPVDTHVYRVSRKYKLAERKSCDMKFAVELTNTLKLYDPIDPVKYDFALCHLGVDKRDLHPCE
ncbi:MAG: TIGR02757 family protein [Candidatus Kapaibacterium sp.]